MIHKNRRSYQIDEILDKAFFMKGVYNNIQKGYFDTFYHEHVSTFSFFSLNKLLKKYNLEIIRAKLLKTQGGSFRAYIKHISNKNKTSIKTKNLFNYELQLGLNRNSYYKDLGNNIKYKINNLKNSITKELKKIKFQNEKIIALGAPARGVVITNVLNVNKFIDHYIDDSTTKLNKYFPGTKVKVIDWRNENILKCKYFILLSWNYEKEILKKILKYKKNFYLIKIFPKFKVKFFKGK